MASLYSSLNDRHEAGCSQRRPWLLLRVAVLLLILAARHDAFTQPHGCDSVEVAWRYYLYKGDFDRALDLVADCEKPAALELRAFVWFKRQDPDLANALLCELLKRRPDYQPDPAKPLPVPDFIVLLEELKKKCIPPQFVIQSEGDILGWLVINAGGGTFVLPEDDDNNPELLYLRLGLQYAEFEVGTIPVMNLPLNKENQTKLPTSAFKLRIFPEGWLHTLWPRLTFTGRFSHNAFGWAQYRIENEGSYSKHFIQFALLLSKSFGPARVHAGPAYSILETKKNWLGGYYNECACGDTRISWGAAAFTLTRTPDAAGERGANADISFRA